jgi:hypothetical protein
MDSFALSTVNWLENWSENLKIVAWGEESEAVFCREWTVNSQACAVVFESSSRVFFPNPGERFEEL